MSDVSKLPKWAQQRIRKLEADVTYWQGKASVGPEESDTFRHEYGPRGENEGQPLGMGASIRFELPNDDPERGQGRREIYARLGDGALEIRSGGIKGLRILPVVSNVFRVELAD